MGSNFWSAVIAAIAAIGVVVISAVIVLAVML